MPKLFGKLLRPKEGPFHGQSDLCLLKHFDIIKELGAGSYSHVYQVRRRDDGRDYALKATDMSKLSRVESISLVEEIRYLASLSHPNIVRYYEAFVEAQWLCIITELVRGGDVATLIENKRDSHGYLTEDEVWSIFLQTALALEELHNCKILHRDVKPANLLLSGGIVKLTDFGISRILERIFTRTQIGTPYYMSPEMWEGKAYSLSSDVWALGCVTLELATLRIAFPGTTDAEVERAVLANRPPLLPARYSNDLDAIIQAMLNPCPIKRPTILAMPEAKRHWKVLPSSLLPKLHHHDGGAPSHHILQPIAMPSELGRLNERLPPAQYDSGDVGMAFLLSRPLSASADDLKGMDGDGSDEGAGMKRTGSHGTLESAGRDVVAQDDDLPSWNSLRRQSVQVGTLARMEQRRAEVEAEQGGAGVGPKARFSMHPLGLKNSKGSASTSSPIAMESLRNATRSEAVLRLSVSVADPSGKRMPRSPRSALAARTEAFELAAERTVPFSGHSFELCPISRHSFFHAAASSLKPAPHAAPKGVRFAGDDDAGKHKKEKKRSTFFKRLFN